MLINIVIFLLVLSFLVFFHELGHFLAAKTFGIYVDRFSIGMPPRVAGIKWGETDYCIGALPIGGFVKMAGQEDAPLTEEEREKEYGDIPPERWFNNKPVWQRMIVLLAGPVANLILAVLLYALLAGMGKQVAESELSARVGIVEKDSPAASAELFEISKPGERPDFQGEPDFVGFLPGDRIDTMDGAEVENIEAFIIKAVLGGEDKTHLIEIERPIDGDKTIRLACKVSPEIPEGEERPRFGITPFSPVLIGEVVPESPAAEAGLREGDLIRRADGNYMSSQSFRELVQDMPEGESVDLEVVREGAPSKMTIVPHTTGTFRSFRLIPSAKGEDAKAVIAYVEPEFQESTGLQRKDVITAINGEPVTYEEAMERVQTSPGETLTLSVDRPRILLGLAQQASEESFELAVDPVRTIGILMTQNFVLHKVPPGQIIPEAFRQSWNAFAVTVDTIRALITRDVSPKDLGGPVMIYQMTTHFAQRGFGWLVGITALISINLAVFNLLPLPVLDGGLLVINAIEGIRRKPLSPVFLEKFQMVGLFFIIGLMLFVTWNDVGRAVRSVLP